MPHPSRCSKDGRPEPQDTPLFTARQRELTTKRRGELAELAFTLKAASLGFGVSKPFGDSERYDTIIDARHLLPSRKHRCQPGCPTLRAVHMGRAGTILRDLRNATSKHVGTAAKPVPQPQPVWGRTHSSVPRSHVETAASPVPRCEASGSHPEPILECPALRGLRSVNKRLRWCPSHPTPPLWRVQVKCSTQLTDGLYRLNAHRRTGGRAVPYLPGEIDFLAAYIIPEDTWYIIPLEAFLGLTSLLFRRRGDRKPSQYDAYREAWRLLRPK